MCRCRYCHAAFECDGWADMHAHAISCEFQRQVFSEEVDRLLEELMAEGELDK